MRKHWFLSLFGLWVVLFSSLDCSVASSFLPSTATPTATSTLTPTLTPPPTPTLMPTVTPTPIPDYVLARLRASDLPTGFDALPPPVRSDQNTIWFAYGYGDQIIFGMVSHVNPGKEQFNFDTVMSNPQMLSAFLALEFTNAKIADVRLYPGLNHFGDKSNGFTARVVEQSAAFQADIFMMRKGSVGTLVVGWYVEGGKPTVSLKELAEIVNRRVSQAVQTE